MKLRNKGLSIGIWSENYKKLAKWYEEVLNFKVSMSMELPNDSFVAFDFGENWFWIGKHSKVRGKSKDPYRIMIGFHVDSVTEVYNELKKKGVEFIAKPFQEPDGSDGWAATFKDSEGNILQLFGRK